MPTADNLEKCNIIISASARRQFGKNLAKDTTVLLDSAKLCAQL